jgi:YesN/AraC family two-component response regulator
MKPKILIVEDEIIYAIIIQEVLRENGYDTIIGVSSVEDAIETIETNTLSLVLIDINLNLEKDGVELARYLLEKNKIPYIFISSYSDKITLERVMTTRPYGYILKPFNPSEVSSIVNKTLSDYFSKDISSINDSFYNDDEIPFVIRKTIKYVDDNVFNKINVSDLAKLTKWKSQHFNRLFTKYVGYTPYNFILLKKINRAKDLLENTDLPVVQISYELSFKSHSSFCLLFKKHTGKTPNKFRKWYNKNDRNIE